MKDIRNANGKLLCRVDEKTKIVEIVLKRQKTIIQFLCDKVKVENVT